MRVIHGARIRKSVHVGVGVRGYYDLGDGVIKIVGVVAGDAVGFGFIPPQNDRAVVLVGVRRHDRGNNLAQEVIALLDICRVAGQPFVAAGERCVHIVILVGRDPVVVGHGVIGKIGEKLLQGRIMAGQRIRRGRIVAAVGVGEEHHGVVFRGVVILAGAVEGIDIAGGVISGETAQRNGPLILRQHDVGKLSRGIVSKIDVFLIRLPGFSGQRDQGAQVQACVLIVGEGGGIGVGVVIVKNAKVGPGFRPKVVGLGRMNVRIVPAGSGKDVVVRRGVGGLLADVDHLAVNDGARGSVHQAVDEWSVGILINLLDSAGDLSRLGPIVILHRDHEYSLDVVGAGAEAAQSTEEEKRTKGMAISGL